MPVNTTPEPKVTVLVPICNVEKYLRECLDSLAAQTMQELQIICLDDGSTDSCPAIIAEYCARDARFESVAKSNSGYGDTMNKGLYLARGEYVGIVESDDIAEPDMFERLYALAKEHEADFVKGNFFKHLSTRKVGEDPVCDILKHCAKGRAVRPRDEPAIFLAQPSIWSGLYRRSFLEENEIRFLPTPGASFQDTGFNIKTICTAERAVFTERAFLHYRVDNGSSSVKSSAKTFCICEEYAEIWSYLQKRPEILEAVKHHVAHVQFAAYRWNLRRLSPELRRSFYDRFVDELRQMAERGVLAEDEPLPTRWADIPRMLENPDRYFAEELGPVNVRTSYVLCAGEASATEYERLIEQVQKAADEHCEILCVFNEKSAAMRDLVRRKRVDDKRVFAEPMANWSPKAPEIRPARLVGASAIFIVAQHAPKRDTAVLRAARKLSESTVYRTAQLLSKKLGG